MTDSIEVHRLTGRDPVTLNQLVDSYGEAVWHATGSDDTDRGDRNYRPDLIARHDRRQRNRKDP